MEMKQNPTHADAFKEATKRVFQNILRNNVCEVKFTKTNGEVRTMKCTLLPDYLPELTTKEDTDAPKKKENFEVINVWDIDEEGWRSFRQESVIEFGEVQA